jgi:hypothetical protein
VGVVRLTPEWLKHPVQLLLRPLEAAEDLCGCDRGCLVFETSD